jgi:hypothetical protein
MAEQRARRVRVPGAGPLTLLEGRDVAVYADDGIELASLAPIAAELERRGARVRTTEDLGERAEVGLYACHTNRFYDFDAGVWRRPSNELSVMTPHDLGKSDGSDARYFADESWHMFDLGLLPGAEWLGMWERASGSGVPGPAFGMRVVGWPKMDHVDREPERFAAAVRDLRERLGLGGRPVLLLACSWSDRRQLEDTLAMLEPGAYDVAVKYPQSSPPPPGGPWERRLREAYEERVQAEALARATPGVAVVDADTDIMVAVAAADVVLSNASNCLYEGVVAGVPGVSVRDWVHPAGEDGSGTTQPSLQLPGVLSGDLASVPTMLRIVRTPAFAELVRESAAKLVDPDSRGLAAVRAADAIEEGLRWSDSLSEQARARLTAEAENGDRNPMLVMMRQLREYERQVNSAHARLQEGEQREIAAREQLNRYAEEVTRLNAAVTRRRWPFRSG